MSANSGFPCVERHVCDCTEDPVANLSAEGYDFRRFIARVYPGEPGRVNWNGECCGYVCESFISQEDATLCAQNTAVLANLGGCSPIVRTDGQIACMDEACLPPDPTCTPDCTEEDNCPAIFWNQEQCCLVKCPDGLTFSYCVAAHTVSADSQVQANSIAYSLACKGAASRKFCISPNPTRCCAGTLLNQQITITGGNPPFTWTVLSGTIPTGVTLSAVTSDYRTVKFSGTPTTAGLATLTLMVQDALGGTLLGEFQIGVIGATPSTLPDATIGTPYTQQLTLAGATPGWNGVYSIASGALPTGLTLSRTGLISGTPTGGLPATFSISIAEATLPPEPVPPPPLDIITGWVQGTVGTTYSLQLETVGGATGTLWRYAVTAGSLPDGLSMTTAGLISGTPTVPGTHQVTIKATNSVSGTTSKVFSAKIRGVPVWITPHLPFTTNWTMLPEAPWTRFRLKT